MHQNIIEVTLKILGISKKISVLPSKESALTYADSASVNLTPKSVTSLKTKFDSKKIVK